MSLLDAKTEIIKFFKTLSILKETLCNTELNPKSIFSLVPLYVHADFNLIKDEQFKL